MLYLWSFSLEVKDIDPIEFYTEKTKRTGGVYVDGKMYNIEEFE